MDVARGITAFTDRLTVEPGSGIHDPLPGGIARAVAAARVADVVLLAIGEAADMSGEGNSRVAITVPAAQQALAEAVAATGTPMVVVLRHGRALALEGAVRDARAILATWFLGEATGSAIADVVFGVEAPTGHLPVSFPLATGQQPWSYDRRSTGRPAPVDDPMRLGMAHWRDAPDRALYGFGHGLTYTSFALRDLTIAGPATGPFAIAARLDNIGARRGTALVQLYLHDRVASRTRPVRLLKDMRHVMVAAGGSAAVTFSLHRDALALVAADGRWRIEPGAFDVIVALSSDDPGLSGRLDWRDDA